MKMLRIGSVAALGLTLAACGTGDTDTAVVGDTAALGTPPPATTPATGMPMDTGMAGMGAQTVEMQALANSGVTGRASLTESGTQTQVMVQLMGTPGNTTHQGHIHQGTCASPGSVVVALQPITTDATGAGSMTTAVDVPIATVMNGQHIVAYHEAGGNPGQPVVCAAIPQHMM